MKFPAHRASLALVHNDHKDAYLTVEQWLDEQDGAEGPWFDWVSDEERQRAIETDSVWTLQWYPSTPVGFHALAASTLEALLVAADGVKS